MVVEIASPEAASPPAFVGLVSGVSHILSSRNPPLNCITQLGSR